MDPPDPMPNSVVKRNSADGSVGSPHVRVGHRQAPNFDFTFLKVDDRKREPVGNNGLLFRSYRTRCERSQYKVFAL